MMCQDLCVRVFPEKRANAPDTWLAGERRDDASMPRGPVEVCFPLPSKPSGIALATIGSEGVTRGNGGGKLSGSYPGEKSKLDWACCRALIGMCSSISAGSRDAKFAETFMRLDISSRCAAHDEPDEGLDVESRRAIPR